MDMETILETIEKIEDPKARAFFKTAMQKVQLNKVYAFQDNASGFKVLVASPKWGLALTTLQMHGYNITDHIGGMLVCTDRKIPYVTFKFGVLTQDDVDELGIQQCHIDCAYRALSQKRWDNYAAD
jgi:hypothetical protein